MYLGEANVIVREDNGAWTVEKSSEEETKILKKLDKEPSVNQLSQILRDFFPNVGDFIFHIEEE